MGADRSYAVMSEKMDKGTAKGRQNRGQEMKEGNSRGKVITSGL